MEGRSLSYVPLQFGLADASQRGVSQHFRAEEGVEIGRLGFKTVQFCLDGSYVFPFCHCSCISGQHGLQQLLGPGQVYPGGTFGDVHLFRNFLVGIPFDDE